MTTAQKFLAAHAGLGEVCAGQRKRAEHRPADAGVRAGGRTTQKYT